MAKTKNRISLRALVAAAFFGCATAAVPQSQPAAQMTMNIAAVVNDDLITVYDLTQRLSLVIAFSNLPDTPQVRQRLARDVLRRLITEKIRMQEAARLKIEIPQENIDAAIKDIETNNRMPPGGLDQFLKSRGIDQETLQQQIRAEMTWVQTVAVLFRGLVTVSDQEVEDELAKIKAAAGKKEFQLSEIFLSYDERPRQQVAQEATRILEQIKGGANWSGMAQTFSRAASSNDGGEIGWVHAETLDKAVSDTLEKMNPGEVSPPIPTEDGIYIMLLRNERISEGIPEAKGSERVTLHQLQIQVPAGADPQTVAQLTTQAQQIAHGASDCAAFDAAAKTQGGPLSGALGTFDVGSLSQQIQAAIQNVPANGASQPMRTDNGIIVMMVCARESDQGEDPVQKAREDIRLRLINEQLTRLSEQHEQKLRLQSFIDIRL